MPRKRARPSLVYSPYELEWEPKGGSSMGWIESCAESRGNMLLTICEYCDRIIELNYSETNNIQ